MLDGVQQEVAVLNRQTEQPLSIALLIDTSGSTNKELKYETDSALKFLHAMFAESRPEDAVALFTFNYEVTEQKTFTHNLAAIEARDFRSRGQQRFRFDEQTSTGTFQVAEQPFAIREREARIVFEQRRGFL